MTQNNMEFSTGKDGTLYLTYWDSLRGDDLALEIHIGGRVFRSTWEGDENVLTPVNLVDELRGLGARLDREYAERSQS